MRKILFFITIIFSISAFAENQSDTTTSPLNYKKSYVYLGLDLGYIDNHYDGWWQEYMDKYTYGTPANTESSGFAGRFKLGVTFNQYISMELGVLFSQEIEFNDISVTNYSRYKMDETFDQIIGDLLLRGSFPIKNFELIGKVGIATAYQYNFKASDNYGNTNTTLEDEYSSQSTWVLGGGVGYHISKHLLTEISYLHYFAMSEYPGTDFVAAGITFKF